MVFLGDYVDRGPDSAGVVKWLREFAESTTAKVVFLRGNHEDAWLQIIDTGWPEFIMPRGNGCLESYRSFKGLECRRSSNCRHSKRCRRCSTAASSRRTSSSG